MTENSKAAKSNTSGWRRVRLHVEGVGAAAKTHPLDESQSHYLTDVLRLRPGATIHPFDGAGNEYVAKLVRAGPRKHALVVEGPSDFKPADAKFQVHVGQGLTSRSRLDFAVEKLTEVGAASITPILDFGGKKDKAVGAHKRWRKVAAAAAAQCGRMRLPDIGGPSGLAEWSAGLPSGCLKVFMSLQCDVPLSAVAGTAGGTAAVLIGRAGGLDEKEEGFAVSLGFVPVTLGDRVLRTETVGMVAMSVLLAAKGEY